ncbi:putative leader peptide [Streptomyces sp. NPDC004082]|uniref:putative leader peptide n=1 Tax=unclassified Streptomyces TaxID=2593676 RepID=UPI0033AE1898
MPRDAVRPSRRALLATPPRVLLEPEPSGARARREPSWRRARSRGVRPPPGSPRGPHSDSELNRPRRRGLLPIVTDTCVHLWRRVHMDLVRYAGCVCRPSC